MAKETLLIVEDNHDLRNGLQEILSFEGYSVITASNGREALNQMVVVSPDLILSDINMPEMDGYQFYQEVRARPEGVMIPFIFLTARGEREDEMKGKNLGAEDYLIKPLSRSELVAAVSARITRFNQLQLAQLEQAYLASLTLLANAIELRDQYTRGHVERVTEYAVALAVKLGLQGKRLEKLRIGAILHDIGKILVNEHTWMKAGPLTEAERAEVMRHPVEGAKMVEGIPYLATAMLAIRHHHEHYIGGGYPDGLVGEAIPLEARIVTVADSFDAMTTTRPYHEAWSLERAYGEINSESGLCFDPMVVDAFCKIWQEGKVQAVAARWQVRSVNAELC
jgi:putative two-component system response regulator